MFTSPENTKEQVTRVWEHQLHLRGEFELALRRSRMCVCLALVIVVATILSVATHSRLLQYGLAWSLLFSGLVVIFVAFHTSQRYKDLFNCAGVRTILGDKSIVLEIKGGANFAPPILATDKFCLKDTGWHSSEAGTCDGPHTPAILNLVWGHAWLYLPGKTGRLSIHPSNGCLISQEKTWLVTSVGLLSLLESAVTPVPTQETSAIT